MSRYFASDSFRTGGQLVDQATWYAGRDKVQHAVAGFVIASLCRRAGLSRWLTLLVVLLAAVAWEVFELVRFIRWYRTLLAWPQPRPVWPPFTDQFSWRDVVATVAGALPAVLP